MNPPTATAVPTMNGEAPRLHPLNDGYVWHNHEGAGRVLTEAQRAQFDRDGYVVLESVVPPEVLARLISEIDPLEAELEDLLRTLPDSKAFIARADEITFTTHLVARSPWLRQFVSSKLFRDLTFDLVGPDARLYWDQAVYKKPDTEAPFPWHQDNGYTFIDPQDYLTCWVALTDATVDNGCPIVVPGVHHRGTLHHEVTDLGLVCLDDPGPTAVSAPVPAGSIVVFSTLTPHCTGPNTTHDVRKAYIVQFSHLDAEVVTVGNDGSLTRTPCDHPDRQFPVLVGGELVPGAPVAWPDA
jgi:ectoine hydroxylase-related dioxygenase (phytanoyl-CoA dioxygenase family)